VVIDINPTYQDIANGAVIVIAVGIDRLQRGRLWRISAASAVETAGLSKDRPT
jgi:hypothetical protein